MKALVQKAVTNLARVTNYSLFKLEITGETALIWPGKKTHGTKGRQEERSFPVVS